MKSVIILALISISLCGFITQAEVDELRTLAPFEVYDADENPFKDYTEEQIRDLFQVQLDYPEGIEIEEIQSKLLSPMTSVLSTQNAKAQSETKNLAVPAGPSLVLLLSSRESVSRKET